MRLAFYQSRRAGRLLLAPGLIVLAAVCGCAGSRQRPPLPALTDVFEAAKSHRLEQLPAHCAAAQSDGRKSGTPPRGTPPPSSSQAQPGAATPRTPAALQSAPPDTLASHTWLFTPATMEAIDAALLTSAHAQDAQMTGLRSYLAKEGFLIHVAPMLQQQRSQTLQAFAATFNQAARDIGYPDYQELASDVRQLDHRHVARAAQRLLLESQPMQYSSTTRSKRTRSPAPDSASSPSTVGSSSAMAHGARQAIASLLSSNAQQQPGSPSDLRPGAAPDMVPNGGPASPCAVAPNRRLLCEDPLLFAMNDDRLGAAAIQQLWQTLLTNDGWLQQHAQAIAPQPVGQFAAEQALKQLQEGRRLAATFLFERRLFGGQSRDVSTQTYHELLQQADSALPKTIAIHPHRAEPAPATPETASSRTPSLPAALLRPHRFLESGTVLAAKLYSTHLAIQLTERFGPRWWELPSAGQWLQQACEQHLYQPPESAVTAWLKRIASAVLNDPAT